MQVTNLTRLGLNLWKTIILFSQKDVAFSIPTSNVSSYLTLFPYQLLSGFFKKSQHFSKCVHGSNCGFNLNFLVINDVDYVFIVATHVSSLMTCLFRYFTLFFFFFFLLARRLMESQFPNQGLNLGYSSERLESQPRGHQNSILPSF